jgi:transketolase
LGQGLPVGVGLALSGKRLDRLPYRVWVLCGDSEMTEGSMWEAFEHAGHARLDNLTAIIDVNRFGQRGTTMHQWNLDAFARPADAFGWHVITVDGHDVAAIDEAYAEAVETKGQPTVIIAKTVKGKGASEVEDTELHGKPVKDADKAIEELGGIRHIQIAVPTRTSDGKPYSFEVGSAQRPRYELGEEVATRKAYGEALAALGSCRGDVVALDGEISNSTHADIFAKAHPERFFEMYIAEQLMVAVAVGLQVRGWVPYASTFAAFFSRAYDFVRMAAISRASLNLVGSHAGVSIGEDGPSQMGLEDLAMFRAVHGSTVLHPCDANQTAELVWQMADRPGIRYLRTLRPSTPVIYGPDEHFEIGGSRVVRQSDGDQVALIAAGITVHEALEAAEALEAEGVRARVIDCYSIKPIDAETLREAARATGGRILTVEDHWPEGGLGDAVLEVFAEAEDCPRIVKVMGHRAGPALFHRQGRLGAVQGLDLALFVHAQHHSLVGRVQVQTHHVDELLLEVAVVGEFEGLHQVGLEPARRPDPLHRRRAHPSPLGHRPARPVGLALRFRVQRQIHDLGHFLVTDR